MFIGHPPTTGIISALERTITALDDGEPPSRTSRLGVHIGSRRVGHLDAETTDAFRPAIEAAAERDEDALTDARLARIPGGIPYVLDLPLSRLQTFDLQVRYQSLGPGGATD